MNLAEDVCNLQRGRAKAIMVDPIIGVRVEVVTPVLQNSASFLRELTLSMVVRSGAVVIAGGCLRVLDDAGGAGLAVGDEVAEENGAGDKRLLWGSGSILPRARDQGATVLDGFRESLPDLLGQQSPISTVPESSIEMDVATERR
jgi:hypothetical protein